jgi:hypothetical protein
MGRDIWTARVESNESLSSLESARSMQDESDVWGEIGEEGEEVEERRGGEGIECERSNEGLSVPVRRGAVRRAKG